jgi:hypothetical protein
MKGGKRALSSWNLFVKKVYKEGKSSDSNYQFKDALRDASKRKGEMGSAAAARGPAVTKKARKSKGKKSRAARTRRRH